MVALEQLDHVEAGNDLLTVGLQVVPGIGMYGSSHERQGGGGQSESQGGAGQGAFHRIFASQRFTPVRQRKRHLVPWCHYGGVGGREADGRPVSG
ncbi:hypothetical protein D3C78_1653190 [compost metagenome]